MRVVPGLAMLLALSARAEGVQVGGMPRDCPQGHDYIQASFGPYAIGALCIPSEESMRWLPAAAIGDTPLFVRVLVVRGSESPPACTAACRRDQPALPAKNAD